jgi:aldose 1-epimerase
VTELGGGLRRLTYQGRPVVTSYPADELPPAGAGQLLAPWPNRVDNGRYEFGGARYQLDLSEPTRGNAIHGLTRWANWEPVGQTADEVTLAHVLHGRSGYPFCVELSVSYSVSAASGLQATVTARNAGSRQAPYGTGSHPYLTAGEPLIDACEFELNATYWLPTDERGIPSGPAQDVAGTPFDFRSPRVLGSTSVDHALTGLARDPAGRAWARLASGSIRIGLWAGPGYDWLQVFTSDTLPADHRRRAVAVEPMTCPPNAFASGHGLITLAPGDTVSHSWGIEVLQA